MEKKRFILIFLGRAMQFMLVLITMRIATTLLSPAEMGKVALVLSTTAFFAFFLVSPVGMFVNRRLHAWAESGLAWSYLKWYLLYLVAVVLIAALCVTLLFNLGLVNFGVTISWLLVLICGAIFFGTMNQTVIPSLNLLGFSGWFVLLTLATLILSLASAFILTQLFFANASYWLLGLLFGQMLLAVVGSRVLFVRLLQFNIKTRPIIVSKQSVLSLYGFAWPLAIGAGLGWVQSQGYRYFMEANLGLDQLGLFVVGYGVSAGLIAGFESVLTAYLQPRLYQEANSNDAAKQSRAWQLYAAAIVPSLLLTVALVVILAPELVRIILGENFQSAVQFIIWGALAEAARVLVGIYSLLAHVKMNTRLLLVPNVAGACLSLLACFLLIPFWGADGAGAALIISGAVMVILMHFMLSPDYDEARVGVIRAMLFVLMFTLLLWFTVTVMRYVFDSTMWWSVITVVLSAGVIYLGAQYYLLQNSLRVLKE